MSRWILFLALMSGFTPCAWAAFDGQPLSYQQLLSLPKPTRMEYLNQLSRLLVEVEASETRPDYAGENAEARRLRDGIAMVMGAFALVPGAEADQPPAQPLPAGRCAKPVFKCSSMSAKQKRAYGEKFRRTKDRSCISGGFFSEYSTYSKRPGTCRIIKEFPPGSKTPGFRCKAHEAMCNPWIFCLKGSGMKKAINGPSTEQGSAVAPYCVSYSAQNNNITERCEQRFDQALKSGLEAYKKSDGGNMPLEKCDPADMDMQGLQNAWNELKKSLQERYQSRCVRNIDFQALFCTECQKMAERIYDLNRKALGIGCAGAAQGTPAPAAADGPASSNR